MKRRVGLFGGTFDPVHRAHVLAARQLLDQARLDGLWVVPSARPPHRPVPVAPAEDRLAMARAAFAEVPRAVVLDAEVRRPGPSYTYDTVAELMAPTHGCVEGSWAPEDAPRVVLLLGADAAREAHTWHRWRELQGLVELVVFARRGTATLSPEERGTLGVGAVLDLDLPDISATALRARLAAGELPEEIPPAVRDVIVARHLYGREGVRPYDGGQI